MAEQASTTTEGQEPTPTGQEPVGQLNATTESANGQEPAQDPVVLKLRSEAASWRTKFREAETRLREREEADMTEMQKAQKRADEAEAKLRETEIRALRHEVAVAKKLDAEAIGFLNGETRKELEAQADQLLAWRSGQGPAAPAQRPDFGAGARPPAGGDDSSAFNAQLRRAAGRA